MSDEMLDSLMTALAEGAAQIHEMYAAYMDAGFSEERAFDLVSMIMLHYLEEA